MWFVFGLGNPGPRYSETRHNIGWLVIDRLAERWGYTLTEGTGTKAAGLKLADGQIASQRALLAEPQTYMNRSGEPARGLLAFYKAPTEQVVVIHDDLDLAFGQLRLKRGGGAGGHNGLRSLDTQLPDKDYIRVRVGIGRPPPQWKVADYVLASWSAEERELLGATVDRAADAVEAVLTDGLTAAMNRFNVRPKKPKPPPSLKSEVSPEPTIETPSGADL